MTPRQLRRAAERKANKAARKAGFVNTNNNSTPNTSDAAAAPPIVEEPPTTPAAKILARVKAAAAVASDPGPLTPLNIEEPGFPFPSLNSISPARQAASRENGAQSQGPLSAETRAISAQNHTVHGLARQDETNFKVLACEDAAAFETLHLELTEEHHPVTKTESILVNAMAQSHWLAARAQRLQETYLDQATGAITDEKKFSLYMRYRTTHKREFHKCLTELNKLRADQRKAELGFEAQKVTSEKHQMKKQSLYWDILKKDALACQELSKLTSQNIAAGRANPGFEAKYEAEIAKRGLAKNFWEAASAAAA